MSPLPPRVEPDRDRPGAFWVRIGAAEHSYVDPDDPTLLHFDYMQRIAEAIDAHAPPGQRLRVVHVGGAGMTLARYVAATRSTSAQIVLEPDVSLTEQVREAIPLPRQSGIKVRPVDGRTGIAAMRDDFADIIIVDAFDGSRVPPELTTVEYFADLRRVITDSGLVAVNVTDQGQLAYTRAVVAGLAESFAHLALVADSATWKGRRFGNLVALASPDALPLDHLNRSAAAAMFPYRITTGTRLARFYSHSAPWTDNRSSASPPPPDGPLAFS